MYIVSIGYQLFDGGYKSRKFEIEENTKQKAIEKAKNKMIELMNNADGIIEIISVYNK